MHISIDPHIYAYNICIDYIWHNTCDKLCDKVLRRLHDKPLHWFLVTKSISTNQRFATTLWQTDKSTTLLPVLQILLCTPLLQSQLLLLSYQDFILNNKVYHIFWILVRENKTHHQREHYHLDEFCYFYFYCYFVSYQK